jgi:hypothetical protein
MRPRRRTAGPTRERVGLLGWSGTAEVGEKDKSRGRRFGAPFRPSWRNPPVRPAPDTYTPDPAAMIRRGCVRGRTRGNIAGEHVARFYQTDHFFAKGIERLKPLPGRNPAARD